MTGRRTAGRRRHELPAAGTAHVRIIAADAATADAVQRVITAQLPPLASPTRRAAGPDEEPTGTRVYLTVAAPPTSEPDPGPDRSSAVAEDGEFED